MTRLLAVVISIVVSCSALVGTALAAPAPLPVLFQAGADAGYNPDSEELAFLGLINDYRIGLGLEPLALNPELGAAAEFHSVDMATKDYFSHTLEDGTTWAENIINHGYEIYPLGENIAAGNDSAAEAFEQWRNSPEHDVNMRNPDYHAIGIGRAYGEDSRYGWYWTTTFGGGTTGTEENTTGTVPEENTAVPEENTTAPEENFTGTDDIIEDETFDTDVEDPEEIAEEEAELAEEAAEVAEEAAEDAEDAAEEAAED